MICSNVEIEYTTTGPQTKLTLLHYTMKHEKKKESILPYFKMIIFLIH